jgi:gas vesicle protein
MGQTTEELNTEIAGTRQALAENLDALQDKVSPSAVVQRRKDAITGKVRGLGSRIMGSAHSSAESASGGFSGSAGAVGARASDLTSTATDKVDGSPLTAGLVAFGIGVVVAGLIPASEAESRGARQVVDAARDSGAVDAAKSAGQDVAANLGDKASEAAEEVKERAQEGVDRVKSQASDSADRVRNESS